MKQTEQFNFYSAKHSQSSFIQRKNSVTTCSNVLFFESANTKSTNTIVHAICHQPRRDKRTENQTDSAHNTRVALLFSKRPCKQKIQTSIGNNYNCWNHIVVSNNLLRIK